MHSNCTTSKFYGDIWCDLATCCFYWVFSTSFLALVFQSHCFKGSVPNSWLSGSMDVQAHGAAALCHTSVCTLSFSCPSAGTLGCVDVQRCRANASPFCLLGGFSHKREVLDRNSSLGEGQSGNRAAQEAFWLPQEKSHLLCPGK